MAAWSLGDEYRQERILELEGIADEIRALPSADGQTAGILWRSDVLDLIDDRVLWLQDRSDQ